VCNAVVVSVVAGTHTPRTFGLRLFKPIAQRIMNMRSKLQPEAETCNAGN